MFLSTFVPSLLGRPHWWALKDDVKRRCRGRCEFCSFRPGVQLHHRHYRTAGAERPGDVMLVCDACHRAIEGLLRGPLWCHPASLLARGDTGKGDTPQWLEYLSRFVAEGR